MIVLKQGIKPKEMLNSVDLWIYMFELLSC